MSVWKKNKENHITVPWDRESDIIAKYAKDSDDGNFIDFPNSFVDNNGLHTLKHSFVEEGRYTIYIKDNISGYTTHVQVDVLPEDIIEEDTVLSNGWRVIH